MSYGIHVHNEENKYFTSSMENAVAKWTALQLYTHGPSHYGFMLNSRITDKIVKMTKDTYLYVHATYLSHPWKGKHIEHIKSQIKAAINLNAQGLILHLPKDTPDVVAQYMPKLMNLDMPIILEMPSMKPDPEKSYETPEKINRLIDTLDAANIINYGICVDTSHIWAAGQNVSTKKFCDNWLSRIVHKEKIMLIHLNGSSVCLGSGKDTHIIPFTSEDKIWGGVKPIVYNNSGVKSFVEYSKEYNIPIIMEINRGEERDVSNMRKLLKSQYVPWRTR